MSHISKEMEILRQNEKEILEIKRTITDINEACDKLISELDTDEEKISDHGYYNRLAKI
jgi:hypothetical protein